MCVDMGGGGGVFTFSGKGGSRKGGFTWGFTKRGVHVNPVNPPGYGPVVCLFKTNLEILQRYLKIFNFQFICCSYSTLLFLAPERPVRPRAF